MNQYKDMIDRAKVALAYDPLNDAQRLDLAYFQMLTGQYEQALPNYRLIISRDSTNANAAAGILWALNSQGKYSQTLREAKHFIKTNPHSGLLYYHQANALLNRGQSLSARTRYVRALNLLSNETLRQLPAESLIWCYQTLNDYPRSRQYLELLDPQSLINPKEVIRRKLYKTDLIFSVQAGVKDTTSVFFETEAIARHRSMSYKLKLEELLVNDAHYRWSVLVSAKTQTRHFDTSITALMLKSEDTRASEGYELSLEVKPRIYISSMLIRPVVSEHLASYTRFNAYQTDLGLELGIGKATMNYQAAYLYQDNDSIGADTYKWIQSMDIYYRISRIIACGLHAGKGDMAWYTNTLGSVTDDFEPSDGYYGASFSTGLSKHFRAVLYYQYGTRNEETSHLAYLRLSYAS